MSLLAMFVVAVLCGGVLSDPVAAQDQHQHRRPNDITAYLEHLDSQERDRSQKPAEVVEALALKPGLTVADLGSGSGYFTRTIHRGGDRDGQSLCNRCGTGDVEVYRRQCRPHASVLYG